MAEFNGKKGRWITTKTGRHIFIEDGKTVEEALGEAFEEFTYDEDDKFDNNTEHFKLYDGYMGYKTEPSLYDKTGVEFDVDIEDVDEIFNKDLSPYKIKEELSKLVNGRRSIGEYLFNHYYDRYKNIQQRKFDEWSKKLPKIENNSVEVSTKGTNVENYEKSKNAPYGSLERREYTENCQRCVIAWEMRRRGFNVQADKWQNNHLGAGNRNLYAGFVDFDSYKMQGYNVKPNGEKYSSRSQLIKAMEKDMLDTPEGSRFILQWNWKNFNCGHTVNAEKVNGKIIIYDAQDNTSMSIKDLIDNKSIKATSLEMFRTDDKIMKTNLEGIIKW